MQITVSIQLAPNQTLAYTPDQAAAQVIAALGGNATVDYCQVYVTASQTPGHAGKPPASAPSGPVAA